MSKYIVLGLCFTIGCAVLLSSCCSGTKSAVVGKWEEIGGTETIEFFKEGTITVVQGKLVVSGNYEFVDDKKIRIEFGGLYGLDGPQVCEISVSKDKLTLTEPNGDVTRYQRGK